jgi:hypothetical protein
VPIIELIEHPSKNFNSFARTSKEPFASFCCWVVILQYRVAVFLRSTPKMQPTYLRFAFSILVAASWLPSSCFGFLNGLFPSYDVRPDLLDLTDKQNSVKIRINLDIGTEHDETHLAIQGIELKLDSESPADDENPVILPGANGARSHLSSGQRRLQVVNEGSFITIAGTKHVHMKNPSWELVWRENKPAGTLICGFEVPQSYRRNGNAAELPEGNIYLSFPVWSEEGLLACQAELHHIEECREKYLKERDYELELCDQTKNPFMKAFHIHKAFHAVDKSLSLPRTSSESIPDFTKVLKMQDDLFLTMTGLVYRQRGDFNGQQNHEFLGTAQVVTPSKMSRLRP